MDPSLPVTNGWEETCRIKDHNHFKRGKDTKKTWL
jgi:hypothetical protein